MTGEVIKEYLVSLGFEVDPASFTAFKGGLAEGAKLAAGLATAVVAAGGAVVAFVGHVAQDLDRLSDFAGLVGESAAEVAKLGYVASVNDSSLEALESSIRGVSRAAGEAIIGIGRGKIAFEKLGISAKDENGNVKTGIALLTEIGNKVRDLSKQEQIATLSKLGIDPTLLQTITKDTSELQEEFDKVFGAIGVDLDEAAQASSDFVDSQTRLRFVLDAATKGVAIRLMPQIRAGLDLFRRTLIDNLPTILRLLTPALRLVLGITEALVRIGGRGLQAVSALVRVLAEVNDATRGWAGYLAAALAAWKLLNLSFLRTPLGMILALGAAIVLLIDDFLTWREGGESLIDWSSDFGVALQVVGGGLAALATTITLVKGATMAYTAAQGVASLAAVAFSGILTGLRAVMLATWLVMAANPIGATIAAVGLLIGAAALLISNWETVKQWFADFWGWMTDGFGTIADAARSVGRVFGFGGAAPAPASAPSLATQAAMKGGGNTVSQSVDIKVNGAADPEATARAIGRAQSRVNGDLVRNLGGAVQ